MRNSAFLIADKTGRAYWSSVPSKSSSKQSITEEVLVTYVEFLIGKRERANLVVQLARFFYISICRTVGRDVALMPYVLPISKYTTILSCHAVMFYVFLNIRQTKFCITRLASSAQRVLAFMPAVQAFMQAACRLSMCSCRLSTPSCSMSMHSCRLPVLSDLLLWSVLMLTGERLCQNSTI